MQELRDATQDYLRQKSQQAQREQDDTDERDRGADSENLTMLDQQDIQDMMDRIQELMEQGRMAEAQQALDGRPGALIAAWCRLVGAGSAAAVALARRI